MGPRRGRPERGRRELDAWFRIKSLTVVLCKLVDTLSPCPCCCCRVPLPSLAIAHVLECLFASLQVFPVQRCDAPVTIRGLSEQAPGNNTKLQSSEGDRRPRDETVEHMIRSHLHIENGKIK